MSRHLHRSILRAIIVAVLLLTGIVQSKADGYRIQIGTFENGAVSASPSENIASGATVTLTVTPNEGYTLSAIKAYRCSDTGRAQSRTGGSEISIGEEISLSEVTPNQVYTLVMPDDDVVIQASFISSGPKTLSPANTSLPVSKDNPYLVNNVNDMVFLAQCVNTGENWTKETYFKIAEANAVFDFDGVEGFAPIGISSKIPFQSAFDGNGVTIKNLHLTGTDNVGLFGYVQGKSTSTDGIKSIHMDATCSVEATGNYVGSIVGYSYFMPVQDCHNEGASVKGGFYVGGIVGSISATTLSGNTNIGNVYGVDYVGGIAGDACYGVSNYITMYIKDNLVGFTLPKGTTMTITTERTTAGAITGLARNYYDVKTGNYYNGQSVIVKDRNKEYKGKGYGYGMSDVEGIQSATAGTFPAITGNSAKTLLWEYDIYEKTFSVVGEPDAGYDLLSVTVKYTDSEGQDQSLVHQKVGTNESWVFTVPSFPKAVEATYETSFKLLNPNQANSKDNPYLITGPRDMVRLAQAVNASMAYCRNAWFRVAEPNAVFDFDGVEGFVPIGVSTSTYSRFLSSFDGNGVTIKNLHLSGQSYVGIFGFASGNNRQHSIEHVTIDSSCSFSSSGYYLGSLVGHAEHLVITDCHNNGAPVTSNSAYSGGLAGSLTSCVVTDCSSDANVSGSQYVGGLIGSCGYTTLTDNLVGMSLGSEETLRLTATSGAVGAIVSQLSNNTGSSNYYNGQGVIAVYGSTEYRGHGYGYWRADNEFIRSATGGYCGVSNVNYGRDVQWKHEPSTKTLTVSGTGTTADFTTSMAPDIIINNIESLIISEGLSGIGKKAFSGWTNLNEVTFDGCSLSSVANDIFEGCTAMAEGKVIVSKQNPFATNDTEILAIVTKGSLESDVYLAITQQDENNIWQGGNFASCAVSSEYKTIPTAKELVYNGEAQKLIKVGMAKGGVLLYSLDDENYGEDIPVAVNAGNYTVYYRVKGDRNHNDIDRSSLTVTIDKAPAIIESEPKANGLTYNALPQELVTGGSAIGGTMQYSLDGENYSTNIPTGTNAQTYTVWYRVLGDANHTDLAAVSISVMIGRDTDPVFTAPTAKTLFYNGTPQQLVEAGSVEGGVVLYSSANDNYSTEIPTGTMPGNYTVWYRVDGDQNHENIAAKSLVVTIKNAILIIKADDKTIFDGDELPEPTYSYSGFVGDDTNAIVTSLPTVSTQATATSGVGFYEIVVSGGTAPNYDVENVSGKLTISPTLKTENGEDVAGHITENEEGEVSVMITDLPDETFSSAENIPVTEDGRLDIPTTVVGSDGETYPVTEVASEVFSALPSEAIVILPEGVSTSEAVTNVVNGDGTCQEMNVSEVQNLNLPIPVQVDNVIYEREVTQERFSICLPYDIPIPENTTAFALIEDQGGTALFERVTSGTLVAFQPYVLLVTNAAESRRMTRGGASNTIDLSGTNATIDPSRPEESVEKGSLKMYGSITGLTHAEGLEKQAYIMQPDYSWKMTASTAVEDADKTYLAPFQAYMCSVSMIPTTNIGSNFGGAEGGGEGGGGEVEPTGIVEVENKPAEGNNGWYTIDGRKLDNQPTKKGLYIHDGRKVMIK